MGAPLVVLFLFIKKYVAYNIYKSAKEYGNFYIYKLIIIQLIKLYNIKKNINF